MYGDWLSKISNATMRHNNHGNAYKRKHLIEDGLWFQKFSPLSSWQEMW